MSQQLAMTRETCIRLTSFQERIAKLIDVSRVAIY